MLVEKLAKLAEEICSLKRQKGVISFVLHGGIYRGKIHKKDFFL